MLGRGDKIIIIIKRLAFLSDPTIKRKKIPDFFEKFFMVSILGSGGEENFYFLKRLWVALEGERERGKKNTHTYTHTHKT